MKGIHRHEINCTSVIVHIHRCVASVFVYHRIVKLSVKVCPIFLKTERIFADGSPSFRRRVAANKVRLPMLNWTPISSQSDASAFFKVRQKPKA